MTAAASGRRQVSSSGILGRFPDQAAPPFRPQDVAPLRIFFVVVDRVDDTVTGLRASLAALDALRTRAPHAIGLAEERVRTCAKLQL